MLHFFTSWDELFLSRLLMSCSTPSTQSIRSMLVTHRTNVGSYWINGLFVGSPSNRAVIAIAADTLAEYWLTRANSIRRRLMSGQRRSDAGPTLIGRRVSYFVSAARSDSSHVGEGPNLYLWWPRTSSDWSADVGVCVFSPRDLTQFIHIPRDGSRSQHILAGVYTVQLLSLVNSIPAIICCWLTSELYREACLIC